MLQSCELVFLPTEVGTIRLDIFHENSLFHVQAELDHLVTSAYDKVKVEAVKKAILLLTEEYQAYGRQ
ncbi:hypothetical protein [Metabacillus malikii]|uniref:DUF3870 domain-containing protein n=1 Tax=Metabacillus malikii TaxID=1504265 RepID=A0ABT9ZFR5_9BACI|nr:hypothetical protein [Metabacillus malikii]MDQ0230403.1 hypothetical protein [Metabacillus malikii]